ncbi:MaoC/PaaZ C-terminal domain-containing protein [Pseudidiomarina sp.]|uniref:MaoC/PaaZ C-terminal domain-containing protein n=1 Tax=Pseudidiomarina sp. TaxID=2081707 RepID=UPI00299EE2F0|nr:MaoC/PaaZ C-terminal domain-containing protein [Pseudidiomarina sp.]MDX1705372.1 MaoC/PaaZ C-terminal domain-containing protein [Pseudidiomarina sp.]
MQIETPSHLPNLPGMFFRSLFTVARNDQQTAAASELKGTYRAPAFTRDQLKRYHQAFDGFVSTVPLTLMYCLAQRAHLAQMLDERFPWPAPGLVHVSNSLEQHAPIVPDTDFVMQASIQLPERGPAVSARRLRPVFVVEFWQGNSHVASCVSEYQVRPKQAARTPKTRDKKSTTPPGESWRSVASWSLDASTSRQYARLSGDFNPIHLHPLLSRWFGFEQPIIHGMYMAARAHAEIERQADKAIRKIDVAFKRPVALPAKITLWQQPTQGELAGNYQICGAEDYLQRLEGSFELHDED